MFNAGANLTTPLFGVVVRKAYGLGVQAMCGASALVGFFTVAWPTAEFAGMNIEGSVKLGYRKELMAIEDPQERADEFARRVDLAYDSAKAVNAAAGGGIDDVITTRRLVHIVNAFRMFKDRMKSIEMCISRFDEETRSSVIDLYTKVDAGVNLENPLEESETSEYNEYDENV